MWFAWRAAAQETRASQAAFRSADGSPGTENSEVARKRERSAGPSARILKARTQGCGLRKAPCSCDRAARISVAASVLITADGQTPWRKAANFGVADMHQAFGARQLANGPVYQQVHADRFQHADVLSLCMVQAFVA